MHSGRYFRIAGVLAVGLTAAPSRAETIQVIIDKMAFSPAEVTARVGDTIEWINRDKFVHTATVKDGWEIMLPIGKSGTMLIDKPGSVEYYCRFHPNMKGSVTATAP